MTAAARELAEVELDAVLVDAEEDGALAVELGALAVELDGALAVELDIEEYAALGLPDTACVGAVRLNPPPVRLVPVADFCDV